MIDVTKLKRAVAFLREEIPAQDISKNPVIQHPHNTARTVPERLPAARIKELSQLNPRVAVLWILGEWAAIGAAIVAGEGVEHHPPDAEQSEHQQDDRGSHG